MGTLHAIGPNKPGTTNVVTTLEQAKQDAISIGANKCIVILLKQDEVDAYKHRYWQGGMMSSELVALLEITKTDVIKGMD